MIEEPWCASFDKAANPATMPLITTPTSCNYMSVHFFLQFCIFNESGEVKAWWATVFENFSQGFYLLLKNIQIFSQGQRSYKKEEHRPYKLDED